MLLCSALSTSSFPITHSFAFGFLKTMRGARREGLLEEKIYVLVFLDSDCWFPPPGRCYTPCLISCSFLLSLPLVSLSTFRGGPCNPRQPSPLTLCSLKMVPTRLWPVSPIWPTKNNVHFCLSTSFLLCQTGNLLLQ